MAVSDAQRRARDKWNRENLTVLTCNVTKKKKEEFKRVCAKEKTTQNAVLLDAVNRFIEEHPLKENDLADDQA